MAEQKIKLTIDSDMKNVYLVNTAIEALCSLIPLSDNNTFEVRLCVVEAVNNTIIHAYKNQTGYEVEVLFCIYPDKLIIKIFDTGISMDPSRLVNSDLYSMPDLDDMSDIKTGGRGIPIIKKIMDIVKYETNNYKNCLIMTKKIKKGI